MSVKSMLSGLFDFVVDNAQIANSIAVIGILVTIYYGYMQLEKVENNSEITISEMIMESYFSAKTSYLRSVYQYLEIVDNKQLKKRIDQEAKLLLDNYLTTIKFICHLNSEKELSEMPRDLVERYVKTDLTSMYKFSGIDVPNDTCDPVSTDKLHTSLRGMLGA